MKLYKIKDLCVYCQHDCSKHGGITRDHVRPISRGGKHQRNIVKSCYECNQMKGNLTLMEWLYAIDFLIAIGIKVENYPPSRLGIIRRNISIILQKKRHNVQSRIKKRTNGRKKYSFLFSKTETLFYAPVFQVRAKNYISYKYLSDFDIENDIPICKWKIKEPKMISSFIFKRQKKDRF